MSEQFIAEAQVLVKPNVDFFKTKLREELLAATSGVVIPIKVAPVVAGGGVGAAAAATQGLSQAQQNVVRSSSQVAGAFDQISKSSKQSTSSLLGAATASGKLDAALLGLRTAIGSSAVIGLGALSLAAIAAGAAIRNSLLDFAHFQQELATFRVTAGASADQMQQVSEEARKLGEDVRLPAVSATDAAEAMTELSKAGLSVQDSIAGARGVLELATAAQLSNADAAKIAANALNSFGLAGDQAGRVADDFANAANAAQGSIADIGIALQQSSAVARQVGLSLEDTAAILSLFAKNGLQGSDAGTSLRVALIRLVAPTDKAAEEIKKLGLNIRDAQGNLRPDVFAQFGEATKNLAPSARDAAAALIFGQDAIRAVAIGAREGTDGLKTMQFQIDQTGTAAEVAGARTEGLAGQFSALSSNLQTLGVQFGALLNLGLTPLLTAINDGLTTVNKLAVALGKIGSIKIPPIHIPFAFDFPGGGIPGGGIPETIASAIKNKVEGAIPIAGPIIQLTQIAKDFGILGDSSDKTKDKIAALTFQLQQLQKARVAAAEGGDIRFAEGLTPKITALKNEIASLEAESKGLTLGADIEEQVSHLQSAVDLLKNVGGQAASVKRLEDEIANLRAGLQITGAPIRDFSTDVGHLGQQSSAAATGVDALTKSLSNLGRQSAQTDAELLKLQSEGGSPQQQIAVLQTNIQEQQAIIAAQKQRGGAPGSATAIKKAREKIIADQNEIESLQAGIASDAKAAAASAKTAADKAQKARDEQFKHLARLLGQRATNLENSIETAGITGNVAKEARLNAVLIKVLQQEKKALIARLKTLKVSAETRRTILDAINKAIVNAQQDQIRLTKDLSDAQQRNADARQTHLEATLAIAEARGSTQGQVAAEKALIAFDKAQIARINAIKKKRKLTQDEKAQIDAYRVDIAERNAALKKLKGTVDDANKSFKELTFAFLQTQAGFAANLLGNLIPGGATGGLVGGAPGGGGSAGGGATITGSAGGGVIGTFPISPFEHGRGQPIGGDVASSAALASSRERGVRPVQVDTTNHLLRQILRSLQNLNGRAGHPEARYSDHVMRASFDGVHGN